MPGDEAPPRRPFLTARWSNLFLANFAVPDSLLLPRLPAGLELDRWEGSAYVSLVAFDFLDTRVLGVPWPGYRNFPEVNLRYYVRHGEDRGVVFVREFVPLRLVATLARLIYNEPYKRLPMSSQVHSSTESLAIEHRLKTPRRTHVIRAGGLQPAVLADENGVADFFKEHHWGFGRNRRGATLKYEVRHPIWDIHVVSDFQIDIEWAGLYGPEWSILQGKKPNSTVIAVGSAIEVYPHGRVG